ncbi:Cbb3-type cytochrome c oxidase subunit CcoP [Pigmentiphaga humi]|uniref:Cbb3-type cytochrome c oxidase subunit n=1 Tax=Pigmentiphaga humi TaxID=2478468 RepID=A0A3P4AXU2_9BURK|nr:cytochrome-c oxidase, cbb3-type subunit III [Pigmentiphaga humi]VCU68371.1 Cbb3-type cytochrome c oxidase subunit CcoP [Pigmentiphaga humi]
MSDFHTDFWGYYISAIALAGIFWCGWLLMSQRRIKSAPADASGAVADTGHVWDEDLRELNNPLPRWWMWMYLLTCIFSVGYLLLYPGLGKFQGWLGWSSTGALVEQQARLREQVQPVYARFENMDIPAIASDAQGQEIGQRLFLNNCAQCHGSDARGSKGFPNLADGDWLYGSSPETIYETIAKGRHGVMPPFSEQLDARAIADVAQYVRSLSGLAADPIKAARGRSDFRSTCAACHGVDGKGNQMLGAPNLTDGVWLYGSSAATIAEAITKGRDNQMPAHEHLFTPQQIRLLTAYVWGLTRPGETPR